MNNSDGSLGGLYLALKEALTFGGCEAPQLEAALLVWAATGRERAYVLIHPDEPVSEEACLSAKEMLERRLSGEPMQYILGEWEFMGLRFFVGEGVLCPRPETELLVETVVSEASAKPDVTVLDLCAGSGCIGISVAAMCPKAKILMLEKSSDAMNYLKKNLTLHSLKNTRAIQGDLFGGFSASDFPTPDIIVSNPPYIRSDEIPTLSKEVLREPVTALDGGADGLDFYRAIASLWLPALRSGGLLAVECGEGQAEEIKALFAPLSSQTYSLRDLSGIERVVISRRK